MSNTTSFVEDSSVRVSERRNELIIPRSLAPPSYDDQTIKTFLAKPNNVATGLWAQASAAGAVLSTSSILTLLNSKTIWTNKLSGFRFFRATAVLRVQINAQPFHQGRLILSLLPIAANMPTAYVNWHTANLACHTLLPNVEVDCRDASCELRIPYVAPTTYASIVDGYWDWGTYYLSVLSPLLAGDASSVEYSVWLSFEDAEFAGPINPQSTVSVTAGRRKKRPSKVIRMGKTDQVSEAHNATQGGPVTSFLGKAQNVANVLTGVPMISGLCSTASWALGIAKGVTGAFGWSKPPNDTVANFNLPRPYRNAFHSNGVSNAESLSLICSNEVSGLPGFAATDVDEMSFGFLKEIEAYAEVFTWAVTDASSTELIYRNTAPKQLGLQSTFAGTANTVTTYTYCPMLKMGQHFLYWRGSLRLHIKFIKTEFHSGRLSVSFTPDLTATRPTLDTAQYVLREIIDIRTCNEVVLELPYMLNLPYIRNSDPHGLVTIHVLNELRAPSTCAQSIKCLMYWGVGDDFELAVPKPTNPRNIMPQSGESLNDDTLLSDKVVGNGDAPAWSHDQSQFCIGEICTSIKMMISRMTSLRWTSTFGGGGAYYPFSWALPTYGITTGTKTFSTAPVDVLGELALGYVYFRGGLNLGLSNFSTGDAMYRISPQLKAAGDAFVTSTAYGSITSTAVSSSADELAGYHLFPSTIFGGAMVKVPYYNATHISPVYPSTAGTTVIGDTVSPQFKYSWTSSATQTELMRGAAEDFQLGYFIGWGPQIINYV